MLKNSERKLRPFIAAGIGFSRESNSGVNANHTQLGLTWAAARNTVEPAFCAARRFAVVALAANKTPRCSAMRLETASAECSNYCNG